MKARLGGALIIDDEASERFREFYEHIAYVYLDLPTGEMLVLCYNDETRLFVADVIQPDGKGGNEFVRCTVPNTVANPVVGT